MSSSASPSALAQSFRAPWLPVTTRVAWEFLAEGVQVTSAVVSDAREHVLRCMPPGVGVDEIDSLAAVFTRDYLHRVRRGRYARPRLDADIGVPATLVWRAALRTALDLLGQSLLRMHYGDGISLRQSAHPLSTDELRLAATRDEIRRVFRSVASRDEPVIAGWSVERLDRLLVRVANLPEPGCPGPVGLVSGAASDHVSSCPRCARAVRLLRSKILSKEQLFAPRGVAFPSGTLGVLAILLHPDGMGQRKRVVAALGSAAVDVGEGAWLVPADQVSMVVEAIKALCLEARPARHHLRGALLEGPGRWSRGVMLGPLPVQAIEAARARHWGEVDGLGLLPAPLPPPPRATWWWTGAAVATALALGSVVWTLRQPTVVPDTPLTAEMHDLGDSWQVRFDTDDLAYVDVVVQREDGLQIWRAAMRASKGTLATGDGAFGFMVPGEGVCIIASPRPVVDLGSLLTRATGAPDPLSALAALMRQTHPDADVVWSERPAVQASL